MGESLPGSAVVRVSLGSFDPGRFADVEAANSSTLRYLVPAITRLPGLVHYYVGVSPKGQIVHASVWDSDEHAEQLSRLREMVVDARAELEGVGVTFIPIVNHPVSWSF